MLIKTCYTRIMYNSQTLRTKGVISLVILAWVFATMGVFARYLGTEFELFEQTYLRIGLAFFIGSALFYRLIDWKKYFNLRKNDISILIFRTICLYLGVTLITEAFLNTSYTNASLVAVLPIMPLMAYFLLRERLQWKTICFIVLGFCGVAFLSFEDFSLLSFGYGELMAFISLIFFDLSYIARKWHSDHLNNYETAVFMFGIGSLLLFVTSFLLGEGLPTTSQFLSWTIFFALLGGAVFNVVNLVLTNYGFQHVKASVASNILTVEAVFALGYGIFLFREMPVFHEVLGGVIILCSVYFVNKIENSG